uniref:NACHT, LRR and PYD domains-containing protein 3-like n=1 Tax=Mastacembelus armatus TaxID=205130 RepID=A0A7N8X0K5_9TELE
SERLDVCQQEFKCSLKMKFQPLCERTAKPGESMCLNEIHTELYMAEGGAADDEYKVRQSETADSPETRIKGEDMFKTSPGRDGPIRTVVTVGAAGVGKTVSTQKFTLDWAEDKANQEIQLLFPFTFRELNVLKEKKFSLVELVHHFFTETKGICRFEDFQVVFIFDGLDECRLPLDFHNTQILTDATESTSVDVLLTNLIRGKLLPSARLWITTRPAAANQIPPECVNMVTEVRGFTDPQKEQYFRKRFRNEDQASTIISHIKTSRSLHIMCHIPVFCWITATVLEDLLETREREPLPKTLTEIYIHFLMAQTKLKNVMYDEEGGRDPQWSPESEEMIESLGKLAFKQLQQGNFIFYESDLMECGISLRAASMYSGMLTEMFKEEGGGMFPDKVYSFVHLSVQEFLAALHVTMSFFNDGVNPLAGSNTLYDRFSNEANVLYQRAVDKVLQSPNGHLDLFLRFLLGLSLQTNQTLLRHLLIQTDTSSLTSTVQYIKTKIWKSCSAEKSINLFHCLNELKDHSLAEEVYWYLKSGRFSTGHVPPSLWSVLSFISMWSEKHLDVFELKKYSASEEALLTLLPVIKVHSKARLASCNLSVRTCVALSSVLCSQSSGLTELDLSNNTLQDSGARLLFTGLQNSMKSFLSLSSCDLSVRCCRALSSVLSSQSSRLKELDLSNNNLKDSGVMVLSIGLSSPHCTLETLRLSSCRIANRGCVSLASALTSNPSHLRELDLSYNHPGTVGMKLLRAGLDDVHWRLNVLRYGQKRYFCKLRVNLNTVNRQLQLSNNNRTIKHVEHQLVYPDHPERFSFWEQLLCTAVTGRCYWEVEWEGDVQVAVSYRGINRKGDSFDCRFGWNDQSWSLSCYDESIYHDKHKTNISLFSNRVAVYVDCPAGTLSFYSVTSDELIHLHTFTTTFTEPLYPGFELGSCSSVYLC